MGSLSFFFFFLPATNWHECCTLHLLGLLLNLVSNKQAHANELFFVQKELPDPYIWLPVSVTM